MPVPINYIAVLGAAIASFALGALWYGPVFGGHWKKLMGFTDESLKAMPLTPMQAMAGGAILTLAMSYVLAHALVFASTYMNVSGIPAGLQVGFWNWLGFIVPVTAGVFLWEGKPWTLWAFNAGYYLVALLLMGAILALWP